MATQKEFEQIIAVAYDRLPQWVREKVINVALIAEDLVSEETARSLHLEDRRELLGLYTGISRASRSYEAPFSMPDTIHLYRIPIEAQARISGKSLDEAVYETLWHEIAHHFGLGEEAVEKREQEEFGNP